MGSTVAEEFVKCYWNLSFQPCLLFFCLKSEDSHDFLQKCYLQKQNKKAMTWKTH